MVCEWRRVARPLSSGVKVGRASSQPSGSLPLTSSSNSAYSCSSARWLVVYQATAVLRITNAISWT